MHGLSTEVNNLQATLAAYSSPNVLAELTEKPVYPHHPITCASKQIALYDDGSMSCDHAQTDPGDLRTHHAVDASVAFLLMEMVASL